MWCQSDLNNVYTRPKDYSQNKNKIPSLYEKFHCSINWLFCVWNSLQEAPVMDKFIAWRIIGRKFQARLFAERHRLYFKASLWWWRSEETKMITSFATKMIDFQ